ncbi:hypothetical protein CASFOL_033718 [Castilleja foliolosa]|uniref:Uncharacterized protein n=1 Tax=Castilleja foliolosa TaxID=1961234 RepID=A0ABD3C0B9_9LAMI
MASYEDLKCKIVRCLGLCVMSLLGMFMLGWWAFKYLSSNDEQWMVPLGLVLFLTPLLVSLALFISHSCDSSSTPKPIS